MPIPRPTPQLIGWRRPNPTSHPSTRPRAAWSTRLNKPGSVFALMLIVVLLRSVGPAEQQADPTRGNGLGGGLGAEGVEGLNHTGRPVLADAQLSDRAADRDPLIGADDRVQVRGQVRIRGRLGVDRLAATASLRPVLARTARTLRPRATGVLHGVLRGVLGGVLRPVLAGVLDRVPGGVLRGVLGGVLRPVLAGVLDRVPGGVLRGVPGGARPGVLGGG